MMRTRLPRRSTRRRRAARESPGTRARSRTCGRTRGRRVRRRTPGSLRFRFLDERVAVDVRMRRLRALAVAQHPVRVDVWVEDGCVGVERIFQRDQRQVLVFDPHQAGSLFGDLARLGGDGGDAVANEAHAISGEGRPVQQSSAQAHVAGVRAGEHGVDAAQLARGADVDRENARVRAIAARIRTPQHARAGSRRRYSARCR